VVYGYGLRGCFVLAALTSQRTLVCATARSSPPRRTSTASRATDEAHATAASCIGCGTTQR
jgi:hypothetical protein